MPTKPKPPTELARRLGRFVRGIRIAKGLPSKEVSERIQRDKGMVSILERGYGWNLNNLERISRALDVPIPQLFAFLDDPELEQMAANIPDLPSGTRLPEVRAMGVAASLASRAKRLRGLRQQYGSDLEDPID